MDSEKFLWDKVSPDDFDKDTEEFIYWCHFNHLTPEGRERSKAFLVAKILNISKQWPEYHVHKIALNLSDYEQDFGVKIENYDLWKAELIQTVKQLNPRIELKISAAI